MNNILQPILQPGTIEFYANNGEAWAIIDGAQTPLANWPKRVFEIIMLDIDRHPGAESALESLDLDYPMGFINQYVMCMYGELNSSPDFVDFKPSVSDSEFCQLICGSTNCKYRGILCQLIHADYGDLTDREVEICKMLAENNTCLDIAKALNISINTVNTHITNILPKIGVRNARAAAVWASRHLSV